MLLFALGSAGDVHPLVGIGRALAQRGHAVLLATNPHFRNVVESAGLEFLPIGTQEEYCSALADPDLWHPYRGFRYVAKAMMLGLMREIYDVIAQQASTGGLIVLAPSTALGARVAQDKLAIPLVTIHLQPSLLRTTYRSPVLPGLAMGDSVPRWFKSLQFYLADKLMLDRMVAPELNRFRRELGLRPVNRVLHTWWHSPQRVIGLFPQWFGPIQPDWPAQMLLTGFPQWDEDSIAVMPPGVEDFLEAGDPPIVFTPGSAMTHGQAFFRTAVAACQRLGRRAVLLTRHREQLPDCLPGTVRHFDFVPFSRLLPRVAALVHHGGIGTSAQGLAAGVPQLVMPMAHDQPDNADRLARLGVAKVVPPRSFEPKQVANSLDELLSASDILARAGELAARMDPQRDIARSCELIEEVGAMRQSASSKHPFRATTAQGV